MNDAWYGFVANGCMEITELLNTAKNRPELQLFIVHVHCDPETQVCGHVKNGFSTVTKVELLLLFGNESKQLAVAFTVPVWLGKKKTM